MTAVPPRVYRLQDIGPRVHVRFGLGAEHEEHRRASGAIVPPPLDFVALLDTGASLTFLPPDSFARLGVQPTGETPVLAAGAPRRPYPTYIGRLTFRGTAGDVSLVARTAELPDLEAGTAIVGRDTLAHGRLVYDGREGAVALALKGIEIPTLDPMAE